MSNLKLRWLLIAACLVASCIVGWTGYGQRQSQSKTSWQYKMVFVEEKEFAKTEEILNKNGTEGWELVQVENWKPGMLYYLKRIK